MPSQSVPARRLPEIPRWGRFQDWLDHPDPPRDPFREVTLNTRFVSPTGRVRDFWGFYAGEGRWGFRLLADETGIWRYTAAFSDGAAADCGRFEVVASDRRGVVAPHPDNPVWFGYRGGEAVYLRAFHLGDGFFARDFPARRRKRLLNWLEQQGYNMLSVASCFLKRDAPGRGRGWDIPPLWPLDPAAYAEYEVILDELEARGFVLFPFAGFFGQDAAYPRDPAEQELYLRYLFARFAVYPNIVYNVAGPEPNLKARPWMPILEVCRLGERVRALDPHDHALTVHNETGDDEFKHAPWTDFGTLQGPKTVNRVKLGKGLWKNHHPGKPLFAQETLWTGNINHLKRHADEPRDEYTVDDVRKNGWVLAMHAATVCYADNDGDSSTGFSGTMDLRQRKQAFHDELKRIWDFMASLPFATLRPLRGITDRGWAMGHPDQRYLIYLEEPGEVTVTLAQPEAFRATWIDARATSRQSSARRKPKTSATWTTPTDGDDWLLLLERRKAS